MKIEELERGIVVSTLQNVTIWDWFLEDELIHIEFSKDGQIYMRKLTIEKFEKEYNFVKSSANRKTDIDLNEYFQKYLNERNEIEDRCRAFKKKGNRCTNQREGNKVLFCGVHYNWDKKGNKYVDTCTHSQHDIYYYAIIKAKKKMNLDINLSELLVSVTCTRCDMQYAKEDEK